jgi:hypothetical protein
MKGYTGVVFRTERREYQFQLSRDGQLVVATSCLPESKPVTVIGPNLLELMAVHIPAAVKAHEEHENAPVPAQ